MNKLIYFFCLFFFFACSESSQLTTASQKKEYYYQAEKVNGISMVSPREYLTHKDFAPLSTHNFNWVAISPFAFVRKNNPEIVYNTSYQWESEKPEGVYKAIESAQKENLKIMLKPQLWGHDLFTGHLEFKKEEDWQVFENTYRKYLLSMVRIADSAGVELFCIGTELANFVKQRPQFWEKLIKEIRTVYSGKITYAENWDKVEEFPFWSQLDFIGSDAYYPLSAAETPRIEELNKGWSKWCKALASLSKKVNKKVLFTEWGYRSISKNALEPWKHGQTEEVNFENQTHAYRSYFESVYHQDWYAGGFLWKWFPEVHGLPLQKDGYTPQGKPALEVFTQLKKK